MIIVLDTNALVQVFGARSPFLPLQQAILDGPEREEDRGMSKLEAIESEVLKLPRENGRCGRAG